LDDVRIAFNDYGIRLGQVFMKEGVKYIVTKIGE
jgi:hypothetical protein